MKIFHGIFVVLASLLLNIVLCNKSCAQFGSLTDGSFDPFNKNNKIGGHIETPFKKPFQKPNDNSGLAVITTSVDKDGNVLESTRSDRPMSKTGQRATLRHNQNSGKAFWVWGGKDYYADPKYDTPQADVQKQKQLEQDRARAIQERKNAIANLVNKDNGFLNATPQSLTQQAANMSGVDLEKNITTLSFYVQQAHNLGIQRTEGLQRGISFLRREMDRRFQNEADYQRFLAERQRWIKDNPLPGPGPDPDPVPEPVPVPPKNKIHYAENLGIRYEFVRLKNGNLGAKLVEDADSSTPVGAKHIRLEKGDIIVELDDEVINSHKDILSHFQKTKVKIIDVNTGTYKSYWVDLP